MRRLLVLLMLLAGFAVLPSSASATTCADYSNQADAQRAADTRDADGDGVYCESLPCPCAGAGAGGGGGAGGTTTSPGSDAKPTRPAKRARTIQARITRVVDGDTVKVKQFGVARYFTVRLIGIDTPETSKPATPVECGGKEATASMLRLAFTAPTDGDGDGLEDTAGGVGRRVVLTTDPSQDAYDRYGRLLAYVRTIVGTNLAAQQLSRGWAKVYVFDVPFARVTSFRSAQTRARLAGRGVWGSCGGNFHTRAT